MAGTDLVAAYPWTAGGHVFVTAQYAGEPWKLWLRESPAAPSVLLGEFPTAGYSPGEFLSLGSRVYFAADDERIGRELWAVDFAAPPPPVPGCVADAEHLCLADGRFRLRADWRDPRTGNSGVAGALPFPGSERTGLFWFFNPANVELIVKMLDGGDVNGFFWTFYGALSDVEYWIDVDDLRTGAHRTYHNPPRQICGRADTTTFDERPAAGGGAIAASRAAAARRPGASPAPRRSACSTASASRSSGATSAPATAASVPPSPAPTAAATSGSSATTTSSWWSRCSTGGRSTAASGSSTAP